MTIPRSIYTKNLKNDNKYTSFFASSTVSSRMVCIFITVIVAQQLTGQTVPSTDYKVKAGFIYNFTQFVAWPDSSLGGPDTPFTVGILGIDPFGPYLDSLLHEQKVAGHPMVVHRFEQAWKVQNCQVLFVNLPVHDSAEIISFKNEPVLTVSDEEDFMKVGGIIRFFINENKIKLQINAAAAKTSRLIISSQLLRLAEIYTE